MITIDKIRLLVVLAALLPVIAAPAGAAEPRPPENGQELLILRNGQILEGRVSKLKGQYLVDLPDGEIRVRDAEVDFVCRSLDEAYQRKRAVLPVDGWQDRLDLARWCQKHKLMDQARAELAVAEQASPNNPMLAALRRQLEPIPDRDSGDCRLFPGEKDSAISADLIAGKKGTVPLAADDNVSKDELDRLVRNLPPGTMETFTQVVQPTLVNNCTATGCHGPQSTTNLRLFRVTAGEAANWRVSQRNLLNVLQYVNREDPAASPLLTVPSTPHGTAKAIFNERRANQFQRLAGWVAGLDASDGSSRLGNVNGLAQTREGEAPAERGRAAPGLLSPEAQKAKPLAAANKSAKPRAAEAESADEEVLPASYQEPPADFLQSSRPHKVSATLPRKTGSPTESIPATPPNQKVQRGAPLAPSTRSDPFDPDVFNRRYHKAPGASDREKPPTAAAPAENPPNKG